jgi:ClpA/ClpB-like protein/ClpX C4-type zinc finger protein
MAAGALHAERRVPWLPGLPVRASTRLDTNVLSINIDSMDNRLLGEAVAARDRYIDTQRGADTARAEYHYAIRRLHASGGSMREIAGALGLSHQRVHQIVEESGARRKGLLRRRAGGGSPERPEPDERPVTRAFGRMAGDASEAMTLAQEEARSLGHHYIGTEHILLGLVCSRHGIAAQLLTGSGISPDQARAAVLQVIGRGKGEPPSGPLRLTPRSKKVLELARKQAKGDHSAHVRGEHLLAGLLGEGRGVAAQVLTRLGADPGRLRRQISMAGRSCTFCGRSGIEAASLVAGPGVYICERCTQDASQLIASPGSGHGAGPFGLVPPGDQETACSFCGKRRGDTADLVTAQIAVICGECLTLCREIHAEQQGTPDT